MYDDDYYVKHNLFIKRKYCVNSAAYAYDKCS